MIPIAELLALLMLQARDPNLLYTLGVSRGQLEAELKRHEEFDRLVRQGVIQVSWGLGLRVRVWVRVRVRVRGLGG